MSKSTNAALTRDATAPANTPGGEPVAALSVIVAASSDSVVAVSTTAEAEAAMAARNQPPAPQTGSSTAAGGGTGNTFGADSVDLQSVASNMVDSISAYAWAEMSGACI